ncbi:MAG TPA: DEAD/DEAH box helicase [Thermoplasmatales archaeon]|nr:DEAD/DEAH box helicase [Thermoplasmatales archaeon]
MKRGLKISRNVRNIIFYKHLYTKRYLFKKPIFRLFYFWFLKRRNKMKIEEMILNEETVNLLKKDGIINATEVQEKAIPLILNDKDVIVQSETGSGKTLAFVLPIIENIAEEDIKALIIAPTRELAKQITHVFNRYSKLNAISVYGGVSITNQINGLRKANIVVGTPGRLLDLLGRGKLSIDKINYLVLDEADRMLDMGFIGDIEEIMRKSSKNKQVLLFSATIPEKILEISRKYMKNPYKVLINKKTTTANLRHKFYVVSFKEKFSLLVHLLQKERANLSIIFCATRRMTDNLARELQRYGLKARAIHGELSQNQRERVLHDFRQGKIDIVVATDVASRGLDVDGITHIYNFVYRERVWSTPTVQGGQQEWEKMAPLYPS